MQRSKPMSSQHDIEKEQGQGLPAPSSLQTQERGQEASMSPAETFPHPPQRPPRPPRNRWVVIGAVIVALALLLSLGVLLIPGLLQRPAGQVTPKPTAPAGQVTPAPSTPGTDVTPISPPGVTPGPQKGPSGVNNPAYWDKILGTQPGVTKVERVSFANIMNTTSLQAVVTVRYMGPDGRLDVYVFNNITSAKPTQLFKQPGLLKGDAKISGYNSVMTAQVDQNSRLNAGKPASQWTADLFREFTWNDAKGTLVQVAFPGIFPDLTRYQAEAEQAAVDLGQNSWKLDALQTARHFAAQFFKKGATASPVSGGRPGDLQARFTLSVPASAGGGPGPITTVLLSRLEGNPSGVWEVTSVGSNWLFIYTPTNGSTMSSPVTVTGFGPQFEAQIGVVYILDHRYQPIQLGNNFAMAPDGSSPPSKFSLDVTYTSSLPGGAQEGIVELVHAGGASFDYGVVMVKVLLNP
jgi:hypothetical protein